jgi:hypothetical protein
VAQTLAPANSSSVEEYIRVQRPAGRHVRAVSRAPQRDGTADAAARTGDEDGFVS